MLGGRTALTLEQIDEFGPVAIKSYYRRRLDAIPD